MKRLSMLLLVVSFGSSVGLYGMYGGEDAEMLKTARKGLKPVDQGKRHIEDASDEGMVRGRRGEPAHGVSPKDLEAGKKSLKSVDMTFEGFDPDEASIFTQDGDETFQVNIDELANLAEEGLEPEVADKIADARDGASTAMTQAEFEAAAQEFADALGIPVIPFDVEEKTAQADAIRTKKVADVDKAREAHVNLQRAMLAYSAAQSAYFAAVENAINLGIFPVGVRMVSAQAVAAAAPVAASKKAPVAKGKKKPANKRSARRTVKKPASKRTASKRTVKKTTPKKTSRRK